MARPERKTVDYFPHYISDGKKMFYIEQKYGNDGYSTWFKILESLASTDDHFLNLSNEMEILFLSAKCRIEKERLICILDDLCTLGEIDKFLWMNRIVYSAKFIESIQDAYYRRSNKCMNYDSFCIHYSGLCTTITLQEYQKKYNNPQSKVNYTKVKESKEDNTEETKPKKSKIEIPSLDEFFNYVLTIEEFAPKFESLKYSIQSKYESWIENGWKDGHNNDIKQWKTKLKNTLPHLKPLNNFNNAITKQPISVEQRNAEYLAETIRTLREQTDGVGSCEDSPNRSDDFTTFEIMQE